MLRGAGVFIFLVLLTSLEHGGVNIINMALNAHGGIVDENLATRSAGPSPVNSHTTGMTGMQESSRHMFEKLDGVSNFVTWKHYMKNSLILDDLWSCIEYSDPDTIDSSKDMRALARINLSVKSNCIQYVRNAKTAKEAWLKLSSTFEDSGFVRRVLLLRTLHRANYNDFNSMDTYIEHITTLVQQLCDIGRVIEDAEVAELLLSGLPHDYDVVVSSLEAVAIAGIISTEQVRMRLIQEEHRRKRSNNQNLALLSNQRKIITCYFCGRAGHTKAKCYKFKKQKLTNRNKEDIALMTVGNSVLECSDWIVDSGATSHMCNDIKWFHNIVKCNKTVCVADGSPMICLGYGEVHIPFKNRTQVVTDVLLIPNLSTNLISVSKLSEKGLSVVFARKVCQVFKGDSLIFSANRQGGIYKLDKVCGMFLFDSQVHTEVAMNGMEAVSKPQSLLDTRADLDESELWHKRLGHLSYKGVSVLRKLVLGINLPPSQYDAKCNKCVSCVEGKQAVQKFPRGEAKRAKQLLELIHSDVCGPMPVNSLGGAIYLLTFTDDFSRKSFGYFLTRKSEVLSKFKVFKATVERQTGCYIKCLRTDGGGEYCSTEFSRYLEGEGIVHQVTAPYSPSQNGVSERLNRTLLEKARCMLREAQLPKEYWGEAVSTAIYLKNRSPTAALIGKVPEEVWTGSKVDLRHLRVFGCLAMTLIPDVKRDKLDSKSRCCIFVGYGEHTKGYRLIDPSKPKQIIISRNVKFFESQFVNHYVKCNNTQNESYGLIYDDNAMQNNHNIIDNYCVNGMQSNLNNNDISQMEIQCNNNLNKSDRLIENNTNMNESNVMNNSINLDNDMYLSPVSEETSFRSAEGTDDGDSEVQDASDVNETVVRGEGLLPQVPSSNCERPVRSTRNKKPTRYVDYDLSDTSDQSFFVGYHHEPQSYEEAMAGPNKANWLAAMQDEFNSLMKNNVWTIVDRPSSCNIVSCKWIYKLKSDYSGNCVVYKARLVARGFSQKPGVDYTDTFSPVVRHSTLRILFCIANELNMDMEHIDINTAFLHSKLDECIYMEQPLGFSCDNGKVCLLNKSLYGLKQASRLWNNSVYVLLTNNGYTQSKCEPCVYFKKCDNKLTLVALYVDDFYIFTDCCKEKDNLFQLLQSEFSCKNLGTLNNCLGIRIHRDRTQGTLMFDQSDYIEKLLERFGMTHCKSVSTPMVVNKLEEATDNDTLSDGKYPYRELIGCLMYLSVCSRPDITYALSHLSQFNTAFTQHHWLAAKRILRYLSGTINKRLTFVKSGNFDMSVFADADFANNVVDRRSYSGFIVKIGDSTVCWESRKQHCVALSTTEAEYLALSDSCKEICFVRNFMYEIFEKHVICRIFSDNQSALRLLETKEYSHRKTKHIDLRYHYVKDIVKEKNVIIDYLSTEEMVADLFTKPLTSCKHNRFMTDLGFRNLM